MQQAAKRATLSKEPEDAMAELIEMKEVIRADVSRVFELVVELEYHLRWVSGLTYISERGRLRPGMTYESVSATMGNEVAGRHHVRQVKEGRMVEIESVTGPLESTIAYALERTDGMTRVICTFWVHSEHPVFGLALPLVEMLARTRLETDLQQLKYFAEYGFSGAAA